MKKKMRLTKIATVVAMAIGSFTTVNAQTNLGASCGCPAVGSRTSINVSSMSGAVAIAGDPDAYELTTGANFTCNNTYILDKKIYVPAGQTLTIEPGTLIKGAAAALPADATALVIERGGTIIASGTEDCPIVFTAQADPMNGTYPISNVGMWGGITILGKAHNNLTLAANGTAPTSGRLALGDGLGVIEGYANTGAHNRFGVLTSGSVAGETVGTFNNTDNSGIMRYVSIRHTGATLEVGAEINGLTLGSVGSGTTIEHIEIISCADDNIELFGGTVNMKYITTLFGNDDMFDWDLGWTGKAQFLFGMKSTTSSSVDSDNGFEADSDDQKSNNTPRSHPKIYNATLIGNSKTTGTSDNSALAAINAKEFTEGEIYNSIFANFRNGFNMVQSISGTRSYVAGGEAWHNWTNIAGPASATTGNGSQSLKVVCNTFVNTTNNLTTGASSGSAGTNITTGADFTQFDVTDKNDIVASIPGFDYNFNINTTTNAVVSPNDVTPTTALSVAGCPTAPIDGFFEPAPYRGAFSSDPSKNWLSDWTYSEILGSTQGVQACPTDLNLDGQTDINDFLIFAPAFGTSCN
ncbi:MAG: hypothetical protein K1X54_10750 [Flavobacteriales bacterium]|nr:hypothetical protein [Flavobacteriales bacterium]